MQDFDAFIDANIDELTRLAGTLTGDRQDAHDVLVEALLKASSRWLKLRHSKSPIGYVRSMIYTEFIDSRRRDGRRSGVVARLLPAQNAAPDETAQVLDKQVLGDALARLSAQQQTAITLRYLFDLPEADIAEAMNCAPGTVRTHLARGLARLREHQAQLH